MAKKRPEPLTGEIVPHGTARGRPSSYHDDIAKDICLRLADGESLSSICRDEAMPNRGTVYNWLLDPEREQFFNDYTRARELQADTHVDEIPDIADDGTNDWMEQRDAAGELVGWRVNGEALGRSKLRIDARKWTAGKMRPKKYGEATLLKHGDADGEKLPDAPSSVIELARLSVFLLSKAGQIVDKTVDQEG